MYIVPSANVVGHNCINLRIGESANPQVNATHRQWQFFRPNRPLPDVVLVQSDCATPSDSGVFLKMDCGKLLAFGFVATMRLLSNYFDLLLPTVLERQVGLMQSPASVCLPLTN